MIERDAPDAAAASPIAGPGDAFGELTSPYRRELLVHCYRMLGSIDDAEDALQDALARAWRGRNTFQRAISFRAWLYRIATNACLDAIERRKRSREAEDSLEVGPIPDDLLDETASGPEARYDLHESISLAFLTAIQLLPPRQRAVLILRDVLSLRAAEVAELLELSVPAVNSALHRARTTVAGRYAPAGSSVARRSAEEPGRLRSILDRYVHAWEAADISGLVALLRDDAVVSMAPGLSIRGRTEIGPFLDQSVFLGGIRRIRLRPIRANRQPGFVLYSGSATDAALVAYAVVILDIDGARIARMDVFLDRGLIARFGVPAELAA